MASDDQISFRISATDNTSAAFGSAAAKLAQFNDQVKTAAPAMKNLGDTAQLTVAQMSKFAAVTSSAMSTLKNVLIGGLAIEAVRKVTDSFLDAAEAVAKFQDMADKTGGSAAGFASMQTAAAATNTQLDSITAAATKLNKNLLTTGQEGSTVAAALKNLNINAAAFKNASPDQRMRMLADTTAKFATNADYAANITALLGKNGAELIPFLKAQADAMGSIFTDDQIAHADAFMQKLRGTLSQTAQLKDAFVVQLLPATDAVVSGLTDFTKGLLGVDEASGKLAGNKSIANWALDTAQGLLPLIDTVYNSVKAFGVLVTAADLVGGTVKNIAKMDRDAQQKLQDARIAQIKSLLDDSNNPSAKILAHLNNARAHINVGATADPADFAEIDRVGGNTKPSPGTTGLDKGTTDNARAEAMERLKADIAKIVDANNLLQASHANTDQTIASLHAAGLTDDDNYYSARIAMIETEKNASVDALNAEIARYQSEKASAKDAEDIRRKIGDAETARTKAIMDAAQKEQQIRIQRIADANKLAEALRAVQLANADALSSQVTSQNRTLAAFGMGDAARNRQAAIDQINDKYDNQARSIQQQLDDPLKQWGAAERAEKEQELASIQETKQKALASYTDYYARLTEMQGDWSKGAIESLNNYASGVANISKDMQKTFDDAFQGMEDALVSFVTTGKLSFTDMVNSIVADLTRIAVKQSITGPLANALLSTFSSSGGTDVNNPSAYTAGSGGSSSSGFASMIGSLLGGLMGRASGGPVSSGGIYRVNELGPELLNVAGKQYLMMGDQPGSVTPNGQVNAAGGHTIINNFTVQGAMDRRTQQQIATSAAQGARRALARNG